MKRFTIFTFLFSLTFFANGQMFIPGLIPQPAKSIPQPGYFYLDKCFTIYISDTSIKNEAEYLNKYIRYNFHFSQEIITKKSNDEYRIQLIKTNVPALPANGYTLKIEQSLIEIKSSTNEGLFYGINSLCQLLHKPVYSSPQASGIYIEDYPRFEWRGMHLDVSRHFFPKEFIKKYIDLLALYKYNTFHWHLTDDQGWRIEIKKYSELTTKGAWRNGSMVGHYNEQRVDTVRYGGFYSQEEIKEIVAYASERHITIVPEIEMPGHAMAALTAYPELSCTGGPFEVAKTWGVFEDVFCAGNEKTFIFLQDVLDEVMQLFPGKFIHIGGDECPKERWKKCSRCHARMKAENLKDEHELQSYFIQRIEKSLNAKGKRIIGWDEILEGGLAPNAAVMSWRGTEGGIAAAKQKHYVVMSPGSHCYFDHYQADPEKEPVAIGGFTPVNKVYNYEPVPAELSNEEAHYILGAQANVWTEYMYTTNHVEYMILPRMAALSEVLWTQKELKNETDFYSRLLTHYNIYDRYKLKYSLGVFDLNYSATPVDGKIKITLNGLTSLGKIKYTLNDSTTAALNIYQGTEYTDSAILIDSSARLHARLVLNNSILPTRGLNIPVTISKATGAKITFEKNPPSAPFNTNAETILTDGIRGGKAYLQKNWLAWKNQSPTIIVDLIQEKEISKITIGTLTDKTRNIIGSDFFAAEISKDGKKYKPLKFTKDDFSIRNDKLELKLKKSKKARYVKLWIVHPYEIQKGVPQPWWLFLDEIIID